MSKAARLSRRIVLGTFLSTIACIAIYCVFLPLSLDFGAAERLSFWTRMATIGLFADLFCTYIVFRIYRPVGAAVAASEEGRDLGEAEYGDALVALERIPRFLLWFGAGAYFAVAIVNIGLDLARGGRLDMGLAAARFLLATAWGFLNGLSTARLLNMLLIEAKLSLRIFDIGALDRRGVGRRQSLRSRLLVSGLAIFLFLITYAGVVFYVRLRSLGALGASGADAASLAEATRLALVEGLGIFGGLLVLALGLYFVILAEMQAHFDDLQGQVARLGEGDRDLARRVAVISFDDIGRMTSSFNRILDSLSETFRGVRTMTKSVYDSSEAIRSASGDAKNRAAGLAVLAFQADEAERERVAELGAAMSSFKAAAEGVNGQAERSLQEARGIEEATDGIKAMVESFAASGQEASQAEAVFGELSAKAREGVQGAERSMAAAREIDAAGLRVGEIAKIIADVAERSNLLAMNASIEAAHGGEAGKGFGVVAREMKTLAMSVAKSAREIEAEARAVADMNSRTLEAIVGLGTVFSGLHSGIEATGAALSAISVSAHRNSGEARRNLDLLDRLRAFVGEILESSKAALGSVQAMESAAERLSSSQARSGEVNAGLTEGVRSIAAAFDELETSLTGTLEGVGALEEKVASYRL